MAAKKETYSEAMKRLEEIVLQRKRDAYKGTDIKYSGIGSKSRALAFEV